MDGLTSADWKDLQNRGFVVVRSFLSPGEIEEIRRVYEKARRSETLYFSMVANRQDVAPVAAKLGGLLPAIRAATDIQTDTIHEDGYFFPTEYTNLSWHTDHKSFYAVQDHYHYLNFWMPVIKPVRDKSGLAVVPMDKLEQAAPDAYRAVFRRGAASVKDGFLRFEDDGRIQRVECPTELVDRIAEAPDVEPGDVIVARTDVLHKTQDAETIRVALTMRGLWSQQVLSRRVLLMGSPEKHQRMLAEPTIFRGLLACFWIKGRGHVTLAECRECLERIVRGERRARLMALAAALLFSAVLLPYRLRSMRVQSGSYLRGLRDLVKLDLMYRRASRAARQQGA
jgi:hypothetical protein